MILKGGGVDKLLIRMCMMRSDCSNKAVWDEYLGFTWDSPASSDTVKVKLLGYWRTVLTWNIIFSLTLCLLFWNYKGCVFEDDWILVYGSSGLFSNLKEFSIFAKRNVKEPLLTQEINKLYTCAWILWKCVFGLNTWVYFPREHLVYFLA